MNIKMSTDEFDTFVMLYIRDRMEDKESIDPAQEEFYEFISRMRGDTYMDMLNKLWVNSPPKLKLNTKRIIREKSKEDSQNMMVII